MEPQFSVQALHITRLPADVFSPDAPAPDRLIARLRRNYPGVRFGTLDAQFVDAAGDISDENAASLAQREGISFLAPGDLYQQLVENVAFRSLLGNALVHHSPIDPEAGVNQSGVAVLEPGANPVSRVLHLINVLVDNPNLGFLACVAHAFKVPPEDTGAVLRAFGDVFTMLDETAVIAARARFAGVIAAEVVSSMNTLSEQFHNFGLHTRSTASDFMQRVQPATKFQLQLLLTLSGHLYDEQGVRDAKEDIRRRVDELRALVRSSADLPNVSKVEIEAALDTILRHLDRSASAGTAAVAEAAGMLHGEVRRWKGSSVYRKGLRIIAGLDVVLRAVQFGHSLAVPPQAIFPTRVNVQYSLAPGAVVNALPLVPEMRALLPGPVSGPSPEGSSSDPDQSLSARPERP